LDDTIYAVSYHRRLSFLPSNVVLYSNLNHQNRESRRSALYGRISNTQHKYTHKVEITRKPGYIEKYALIDRFAIDSHEQHTNKSAIILLPLRSRAPLDIWDYLWAFFFRHEITISQQRALERSDAESDDIELMTSHPPLLRGSSEDFIVPLLREDGRADTLSRTNSGPLSIKNSWRDRLLPPFIPGVSRRAFGIILLFGVITSWVGSSFLVSVSFIRPDMMSRAHTL